MNNKVTILAIALLIVLIGIGGFLVGRTLVRGGSDSNTARLLDEKTRELEEKNRQIQDFEKETVELRKDLEESAKQVSNLQNRLEQANRGLSSIQDRLKTASRAPQASRDPYPSGASSRSVETGSYETLRETPVFADASSTSKRIANIPKGTKVNVVGAAGDWLEVRSKHGNPPGYIRREDAKQMGAN